LADFVRGRRSGRNARVSEALRPAHPDGLSIPELPQELRRQV
jgi:hypothetical protein